MKIVVFSDSHNAPMKILRILNKEQDADAFIFLGDGYDEAKSLIEAEKRKMYCVRGNCDSSFCGLDEENEIVIGGKKIFFCHGHRYRVKWGLDLLAAEAAARGANAVLYGHTHTADESYRDGIYFLNPGSASGLNASYGILEVRDNGILFSVVPITAW